MKRYEVVDKGNSRHVLTITPKRVTIKFKADTDAAERKRILTFLDWVSQTEEMDESAIAFRGRTDVPPNSNTPLLIQMCTDGGLKYTFREDEMIENVGVWGFEPSVEWET